MHDVLYLQSLSIAVIVSCKQFLESSFYQTRLDYIRINFELRMYYSVFAVFPKRERAAGEVDAWPIEQFHQWNFNFQHPILIRPLHQAQGSFKNYVDKMRWVSGQKMPILVHGQGNKCPRGGRQVVKKGQNHVHVVIE